MLNGPLKLALKDDSLFEGTVLKVLEPHSYCPDSDAYLVVARGGTMIVWITSPKFEGLRHVETSLDKDTWCAEVRANGGVQVGDQFLKPEDLRTEFM